MYVRGIMTEFVIDASYQGYVMGGAAQPGALGRMYPDYKVYRETKYKSVLPENQKAVVEMVKAAAVTYGFDLRVIDVTEKRFLGKFSRRLNRITTFPTFVTDSGFKLEGSITEEGLKDFFVNELRLNGRVVRDSRVKMRMQRGMLSFYMGVFILTAVGLAVMYYGLLVLSGWYLLLFISIYMMVWVALPALTVDFTRNKLSAKKVLVLTLGVMLVSTLFTHLVWTIAAPKWSFSVSTDKSAYGRGEPVIITASLRNIGLFTQSFPSFTNDPIIFLIIEGRDPNVPDSYVTVIWNQYLENPAAIFSLSVGETLQRTSTWNQVYTFNRVKNQTVTSGIYSIQAFIPNTKPTPELTSNPLFSAWTSINITSD